MVEDTWVIPLVIVLITSIFTLGLTLWQRFSNKNEKIGTATLTGTIHLDFLNKELKDLTSEFHEFRNDFYKLDRRVEVNTARFDDARIRIQDIERKIAGYRNGSVNGNGVHK